jgi:hypothetical protein
MNVLYTFYIIFMFIMFYIIILYYVFTKLCFCNCFIVLYIFFYLDYFYICGDCFRLYDFLEVNKE